jgi:tRNA threonylcarbamoyladenosine biosynthesis protein TsaE
MLELITSSEQETIKLAANLGKAFKGGEIVALFGDLGTGKTVFVKGVARALRVKQMPTSPSFVIIRHYQGKLDLYHMDLYRLDKIRPILHLGIEDYIYSDGVTIIEWADRIINFLPKQFLKVEIKIIDEHRRQFIFVPFGKQYEEIIEGLKKMKIKNLNMLTFI